MTLVEKGLFVRRGTGSEPVYFLRPDFLIPAPLLRPAAEPGGAEYVDSLRKSLRPDRLRAFGYNGELDKIPDGTLEAAAASGILSSPDFLDIIEIELQHAPCLCCYHTTSASHARRAAAAVETITTYFNQSSYLHSNAFYRSLCALLRDISRKEKALVLRETKCLPSTTEAGNRIWGLRRALRSINRSDGVCFLASPHGAPPGATTAKPDSCLSDMLWVYSTPEARQLLRKLGRSCKAAGLTLGMEIAPASALTCLRHKHRVYIANCYTAPDSDHEAETARVAGAKSFWRLLGEVVPSKRLQQDEKKRVSTPAAGQAVPTTQGTQRGPRSSSRRKKKRKSRTEGVDPKTSQ
jgi:hypothetical protein